MLRLWPGPPHISSQQKVAAEQCNIVRIHTLSAHVRASSRLVEVCIYIHTCMLIDVRSCFGSRYGTSVRHRLLWCVRACLAVSWRRVPSDVAARTARGGVGCLRVAEGERALQPQLQAIFLFDDAHQAVRHFTAAPCRRLRRESRAELSEGGRSDGADSALAAPHVEDAARGVSGSLGSSGNDSNKELGKGVCSDGGCRHKGRVTAGLAFVALGEGDVEDAALHDDSMRGAAALHGFRRLAWARRARRSWRHGLLPAVCY